MNSGLFPGWGGDKNFEVVKFGGKIKVMVKGRLYMEWPAEDEISKRGAIVNLSRCGLATIEDLSQAFDLNVRSVQRYVAIITTPKEKSVRR